MKTSGKAIGVTIEWSGRMRRAGLGTYDPDAPTRRIAEIEIIEAIPGMVEYRVTADDGFWVHAAFCGTYAIEWATGDPDGDVRPLMGET